MGSVKKNYVVKKAKMLVIIEMYKHWRHYLENTMYSIKVVINHLNFWKGLTTKTLSGREKKWWKRLSGFELAIKYHKEKNNPADSPSKSSNYIDEEDKLVHIVGYII